DLLAHCRLHAVATDQRAAAVRTAGGVVDGDAFRVLGNALHVGRRQHLDATGILHAFEQRGVDVRPVDHGIRIAEARAERFAARPRARARTPSASKAANAFGPSCTPAPISPIGAACSSTLTGYPRRESASAHASPPIPPPAISTGAWPRTTAGPTPVSLVAIP